MYVTFEEMNRIKEAIREGSLWELVEERCRSHPKLLEAYRVLRKYMDYIERFDPVTKNLRSSTLELNPCLDQRF